MKELLKKLIQAQPTLQVGELAAANVLADYFRAHNIDCVVDNWDGNRANLIARLRSAKSKPALLFAAHLDVVPPGDVPWKYPPFDAVEADGRIHGRGATDMKAGIVATAAAIVEIADSDIELAGDLIFVATAGEETDGCGVKRFIANDADDLPELAGAIIPEPTDFDIVTAHRGILWLRISTSGKTAHGSTPQLGINAIMQMNILLSELKDYRVPCTDHPLLGKCSLSVNQITGGKAANVVPDECSIKVDIRTLPDQDHERIIDDLKKLCSRIKSTNPDFEAKIEMVKSADAMQTDNDSTFVKTLCEIAGISETQTVSYTTDGSFLKSLNKPIAVFGPGKAELCHKPDEYVDIADVEKGKDYFSKVIRAYLT